MDHERAEHASDSSAVIEESRSVCEKKTSYLVSGWKVGERESTAICDSWGYVLFRGKPEFTEEQARLIAAAPDMLNALKMCVIERSEWLVEAKSAIAKAEGK